MLACPATVTTTDWPAPATLLAEAAVHVRLVDEATIRLPQATPPRVTAVAPDRVLKPVPVTVRLLPVMGTAAGVTLATVAAAR